MKFTILLNKLSEKTLEFIPNLENLENTSYELQKKLKEIQMNAILVYFSFFFEIILIIMFS